MELSEYRKIVFHRISKIDPENVENIICFLLLHDHYDQEMARLALAPDHDIQQVVHLVKTQLHLLALRSMPAPVSSPPPSPSSGAFVPFAMRDSRTSLYPDSMYELQKPAHFFCLDDHIEPPNGLSSYDCSYVENAAMVNKFSSRTARHHSTVVEYQPRICHYYSKGNCKHGNSCRYLHSNQMPGSFSQMYNVNDDHVFRPGSLERLEFEIVELLRSRRGSPISIASLPMIYYEKYGKVLQAEGYLTESQRHGKSGFSLTKLLTRLKSSIQVIDRPHGQHSVILAEDALKFIDHRKDKNDTSPNVSSARQIYMTFPADSSFTEDDVSDYFSIHYGLVEDVRIPCQQRRMFGFVTFHSVETVKLILSEDSEHLICGARVLVKPYREKSKLLERKNQDRIEQQQQQAYFSSHYNSLEPEQLHSNYDSASTMLRLRIEEQQRQQEQHALEVERSFTEMTLMPKSATNCSYFSYQMKELRLPVPEESFDRMMNIMKSFSGPGSGSSSGCSSIVDEQKPPRNTAAWNHPELNLDDSEGYNLPDSPFESGTGNNNT
ncbi:zinc finger CCCH domain-containing protein 18-like [Cucurbita moschata]|uniref:Zinc finger CCCH domain-containing protein 18-like n=1 Tax=Cucurbita moschata TaxID=3662 RepID=A0A6J1EWX1_CUCMO|nr:zinc finger CCCH domain-containing protein 18-like [Cucurbita moschata]